MTDLGKTSTEGHLFLTVAALMLCSALAAACSQTPRTPASETQTQQQTPPPQVKNTPPPVQPAKVKLNNEEKGTTADLTEFTRFLKGVMKGREEQFVTRPGTDIIEKTVLVRIDRSVKLGEVVKVFKAIGDAGASPLRLLIKARPETEAAARPYMLRLRVDIGDEENTEDVADGIELQYFDDSPVSHDSKNSLLEVDAVVELQKEGEYLVNAKPVGKSALSGALQARFKEMTLMTPKKTLTVLIPENSQLSYASLSEVANAAFEAKVQSMVLYILTP